MLNCWVHRGWSFLKKGIDHLRWPEEFQATKRFVIFLLTRHASIAQGFFTGIGKGIVGTVAKPAAGVLDLASGAAAAVRGSARSKQYAPKPVRLKRNCYDSGGVLPSYSRSMAEGQDVLLKLNECDITER